jgi:predicted transcriptional regulator
MSTKKIEIKVQSHEEGTQEALQALHDLQSGKMKRSQYVLAFENLETMRKFLTPQRILLFRFIKRAKPKSVYELANLLGRDRKAVAEDLKILENLGLVSFKTSVHNGRARVKPITLYDSLQMRVS